MTDKNTYVRRVDFILKDVTGVFWPGIPPYRNSDSRYGYKSFQKAQSKLLYITKWCAANYGLLGGPNLRIVERIWSGKTKSKRETNV